MIIIRNLSGPADGICEYEIRINERRITTFKHSRPEGLAKCLEKASQSILLHDAKETIKLYGELKGA